MIFFVPSLMLYMHLELKYLIMFKMYASSGLFITDMAHGGLFSEVKCSVPGIWHNS
jgi:hypothetical protein